MPAFALPPLNRFRRDRRGNVGMIFALTTPVLALGMAIAVDFTNASVARARLNAAADAAALSALTPYEMQQTNSVAQTAATNMFKGSVASMSNVTFSTQPTITVVPSATNSAMRVVTVTYSASVTTLFGGILSFFGALPANTGIVVGGTSTAQAAGPPNINFYLLLDNSPSMSLPASSSGITLMESYTPTQDGGTGCAFACHQASTGNGDTMGNLCSDFSTPTVSYGGYANQLCASKNALGLPITQLDNYAEARHKGLTLRLDELTAGVTTLMSTAYNWQTTISPTAPPTYQFAAYSMDTLWSIGTANNSLMSMTTSYQSQWALSSAKFGVMEMWANNSTCNTAACTGAGTQGDTGTAFDTAMASISSTMPKPGNGTSQAGDTPQEILFLVTDGVEDEATTTCTNPLQGGNRCQAPMNPALCTSIKARGIKIAVLYTEYLAVTTDNWYNSWVAPFQSTIATQLQSCASPNLFYDATADTNLGQALATLFTTAMQQSAALSN